MSTLTDSNSDCGESGRREPRLLHEFFARAAERWPARPAVEVPPGPGRPDRRVITYAQLRRRSDSLSGILRARVDGESVVAILLPRNSEHLYCAQLAVLCAGAAYSCIDPSFPDDHVRHVLQDSGAVVLLTDDAGRAHAERCGFDAGKVLEIVHGTGSSHRPATVLPPPWLVPSSLAYVIYTSGSTGPPKGVMIEHRSIASLVQSDLQEFRLSPEDRVAQSSSAAYDSSVEETWLAWAAGATLVVVDDDTARLGPDLIPWLRAERITVFCPPPTLLRATGCTDPETSLPDLSLVYVGGEALPQDIADRWAPGRRLVNGYGPTECTVTAMRAAIRQVEPVTIGRPIPGLSAWVLNDSLEKVDDGQQGELCVGGIGLARGYLNLDELTAEKFPQHPKFGRIYRTGDLVHRNGDGTHIFHGRIDSQVKIRGYRVELEAIESRLAACDRVREAVCRVQHDGAQQTLVAFIVPQDERDPPPIEELQRSLREVLPNYMIPSRMAMLPKLPVTIGGKLNRRALPHLEPHARQGPDTVVPPRNRLEAKVAAALREVLYLVEEVSIHDDFFVDLGGDSLRAAQLVTLLRDDTQTASLTVRDVYEARSVAAIARRASPLLPEEVAREDRSVRSTGRPLLTTLVQAFWLLAGLTVGALVAYFVWFQVFPFLLRALGPVLLLICAPLLALAALAIYTPWSVLLAVLAKKCLIGRYRPQRVPLWSSFYVRNWMVQRAVSTVPWWLLTGTDFQLVILRALGARIGRRVHIHRGVNLVQGGWDLLEIGDDVTLSQDASIRLIDYDDGHLVVGPVFLGDGVTLDVRAGMGGQTRAEPGAWLAALSFLPCGGRIPCDERWAGVPAEPAGQSPAPPPLSRGERILSPVAHGLFLILARLALGLVFAAPFQVLAVSVVWAFGWTAEQVLAWIFSPAWDVGILLAGGTLLVLGVPATLLLEALTMNLLGRVDAGVTSRWSLSYVRIWLKTGLVLSAEEWLSGTLFWPLWLRLAGMKVGPGCEISSIIDVVPELIDIGQESFLADGIYLGGPRVHRGTVTLAATRLGRNTFLGNHVVVVGGQRLPDDILLGVCTVANADDIRPGTSWFGIPPFELPRREVIECSRQLTHEPSWIRYLNRMFWEVLRCTLPVLPILALLVWCRILAAAEPTMARSLFYVAALPAVTLAAAGFFCLLIIALKWMLLGRVRPGQHPLWSCWCSRWDFLYVAWGFYARGILSVLDGTLLLTWYLRAMGAHIGRRVALGSGFAQVVDPDMLDFEDGATVNCLFQAHSFEDRVLKIDRVTIRRRATVASASVLLYGADIGPAAHVAAHSVVMKHERLAAGRAYVGCPTRSVRRDRRDAPASDMSQPSAEL